MLDSTILENNLHKQGIDSRPDNPVALIPPIPGYCDRRAAFHDDHTRKVSPWTSDRASLADTLVSSSKTSGDALSSREPAAGPARFGRPSVPAGSRAFEIQLAPTRQIAGRFVPENVPARHLRRPPHRSPNRSRQPEVAGHHCCSARANRTLQANLQ
jgi:hypothetical protein